MAKPKSDIADARHALREALKTEPDRGPSAYARVKELLPDIEAAKAKRFTDLKILELLKPHGVELALGTFRLYVHKASKEAGRPPKRTRRPKAADAAPAIAAPKAAPIPNPVQPKPSDLASAPRPAAGAKGKAALGHKLGDDDV